MIVTRNSLAPVDFDGLRILDYTAGRSLSSSLAVVDVPPFTGHAEAWSKRSDKYYLVTHGRIRFMLEDETHDLQSGDFCHVRRGRRFSYRNDHDEGASLVLFHTPSFDPKDEVFVGSEE